MVSGHEESCAEQDVPHIVLFLLCAAKEYPTKMSYSMTNVPPRPFICTSSPLKSLSVLLSSTGLFLHVYVYYTTWPLPGIHDAIPPRIHRIHFPLRRVCTLSARFSSARSSRASSSAFHTHVPVLRRLAEVVYEHPFPSTSPQPCPPSRPQTSRSICLPTFAPAPPLQPVPPVSCAEGVSCRGEAVSGGGVLLAPLACFLAWGGERWVCFFVRRERL